MLIWLFISECPALSCFGYFNVKRLYADEFAAAFANGEDYSAIDKGIDCVIFAHADIKTRMVNCAALAFDDVACFGELATE